MYKLTKEDKEFIKTIETQLRTALESDYARNVGTAKMNQLRELWERITGEKYPVGFCTSCQLRLLKKVAKWLKDHAETEPQLKNNKLDKKAANKEQ